MRHSLSRIAHRLHFHLSRPGQKKFDRALRQVRETQEWIFRSQLRRSAATEAGHALGLREDMSLEAFQEAVPLTDYEYWRGAVERQWQQGHNVLTGEVCGRYQPSGSSEEAVKWIPYGPTVLHQIEAAVDPWLSELYNQEPRLRVGKHFWSFPWVPADYAGRVGNLHEHVGLSLAKRRVLAATSVVPPWMVYTSRYDAFILANLCQLAAARDLSFLSVWSPVFALDLLEALSQRRDEVAAVLNGTETLVDTAGHPLNAQAAALLQEWDGHLSPEFLRELWPSLGVVSASDGAAAAPWADAVRALLPAVRFQGKGLWGPEGVVTLPYRGSYPLAVRSHFYEFVDLDSEAVVPAWQLEQGQEVRPVLTTASGLLRYALPDRLLVSGFMQECPTFTYLGRAGSVDIVGERLNPTVAETLLSSLHNMPARKPLTLIGVDAGRPAKRPFYLVLCEGSENAASDQQLAARLEIQLREHFHYDLARDLGHLAPLQCFTTRQARAIIRYFGERKNRIVGDTRPEPLIHWEGDLHPLLEAFLAQDAAA
ncbi:hypothetical protein CAI21_18065 [Alkalilimnicola ehrlichii]|uniref:GH3 middle domain-containing protein n=1 Tax=Alkalilimnicola ehrlichii TaxID=351052 RepID=A0A3E0WMB4_9GAMM|nr:GH3 auxin-responsive promoter family protein [Alkalilimnicola ehrlichii]RFA25861.1 hypothetical protein CAI21_18065 [Alkalilimnicola ehrlichii]RFA33085.1 hypothetical protein CAL65_18115 [Alkalilimnicola ehrlichii]